MAHTSKNGTSLTLKTNYTKTLNGPSHPGNGAEERPRRRGLGLIVPILLLLVWQLVSSLSLVTSTLLPNPSEVVLAFFQSLLPHGILTDVLVSLGRTAAGFAAAAIVGTSLGLLMGAFRPLYMMSVPMVDFFRSTPITTLYPLFVLTLGISHLSKIGMVFGACVFIVALNAAYGVFQSNPARRQMAVLYGASRVDLFRFVLFFDALPQTLIGLRVALSLAWVVEILCEMFMGSEYGVGQRLIEAFTTYAMPEMYAIILLNGSMGYALNRCFVKIERALVPWTRSIDV